MASSSSSSSSSMSSRGVIAAAAAATGAALACASVYLVQRRKRQQRDKADAATPMLDADSVSTSLLLPTNIVAGAWTGSSRPARILAMASSFPPYEYPQSQLLEVFLRRYHLSPADEDFARRVWLNTQIQSSRFFLPKEDLFKKMTRTEYIDYIKPSLLSLGVRAAREAIEQWGGSTKNITHIIWGTSTGSIHAPTMDVHLSLVLGLPTTIERLNIESMGCATGFRCLGLANEIAQSNTNNVVLVVVADVRSALTNQLPHHTPRDPMDHADILASALFRDGGGAAIVSAAERCGALPQLTEGSSTPASITSSSSSAPARPDSPSPYTPPSPSLVQSLSLDNLNLNGSAINPDGSRRSSHSNSSQPPLHRVGSNSPSIAPSSSSSSTPPLLSISSMSRPSTTPSPYARHLPLPHSHGEHKTVIISGASLPRTEAAAMYEILSHQSVLIRDTFGLYSFTEGDDTTMHLAMDKEMPAVIEAAVGPAVADLLRPFGLTTNQCCFAIHTAGPKVMTGIARALGIRKERMASSWHTMMRYGDLSGASNLIVVDQWRHLDGKLIGDARRHQVCISFGPGIGLELILLRSPTLPA